MIAEFDDVVGLTIQMAAVFQQQEQYAAGDRAGGGGIRVNGPDLVESVVVSGSLGLDGGLSQFFEFETIDDLLAFQVNYLEMSERKGFELVELPTHLGVSETAEMSERVLAAMHEAMSQEDGYFDLVFALDLKRMQLDAVADMNDRNRQLQRSIKDVASLGNIMAVSALVLLPSVID